MTNTQVIEANSGSSLRLWPGIAAAILLVVFNYVVPAVVPDGSMYGLFGGLGCALVIFLWWLFFSRAPWLERLGSFGLIFVALIVTSRLIHISIAEAAQGLLFPILALPGTALAIVAAAVAGRGRSVGTRRWIFIVAILLACNVWTLVRTGGFTGGFVQDLHWRWTPTPEELLLAKVPDEPKQFAPIPTTTPTALPEDESPAEWPGFRGANRDGIIRGVRIGTDWSKSPPVELWRRAVGPGWSSFAVRGELIYTQEQRGEEEVVACYELKSGKPVWMHSDKARFWEPAGGAGPRATPTLSRGRVLTLGATGILNALDATSGAVVWTRNAATDTGAKLPGWGFAGSPLVFEDLVIVATSGKLSAYDFATGDLRWLGPPSGGAGYSSPHLATVDGVPQVLLMTSAGAISVAPTDGKLLWKHEAPTGSRIVQPAVLADGNILMSAGEEGMGGAGMHRIAISRQGDGWLAEENWISRGLKPNFNDYAEHEGHVYGFDGNILACVDLADGKRNWKGGRYGSGQLILLPDQDLLLVIAEDGRLALVNAAPEKFNELAKFRGLKSKTWNHPVLVGDILLIRNSEEMAAFRLADQVLQ